MTVLHHAARQNDHHAALAMLEQGAKHEARDEQLWTPLHWACVSGSADVALLLLERGADIEARARFDMRPLHWAALRGHGLLVALLVERGAEIDATNLYGMTPLHEAATGKVAKHLLKAGAAIDAVDHTGMTPLHRSRAGGVAQVLVETGADMMIEARDGRRPVDMTVATSEEVFGVAVYPQRKRIRMQKGSAQFGLTVRSFADRTIKQVQATVESDACQLARARPETLEALQPGQLASIALELQRVDETPPGIHPVTLHTWHGDEEPMVYLELEINTEPGSTPEDRGFMPVSRVTLRQAPARWREAAFVAVPLLLIIGWLVGRRLRRRSRDHASPERAGAASQQKRPP